MELFVVVVDSSVSLCFCCYCTLHPLLQCFRTHKSSIRTCQSGIQVRWQVWIPVSVICNLTPSLCGHAFRCSVFKYNNSNFIWPQFAHVLVHFDVFVFLCVGCLFFLCCCAPSLAVFQDASVFNQDVSEWNTVAVTTMQNSKCNLALPLLCYYVSHLFTHTICFFFRSWNGICTLLQCLKEHLHSIMTCQNGIRLRWHPCGAVSATL